ncbi:hypothetical protein [Phenylobacterium sp.]|uniref:alpha/beta hydrolase family protein n=1 Tax=Phenylobacterium sp. TaxID=1871053 RepID=UPI0027359083|nr:hypothetical protein [Phenylobacterium sp.]MDP3659099.1 hypothetical protein [Phenylobacterium sp.]
MRKPGVGHHRLDARDAVNGEAVPVRLFYPTFAIARPTDLGPYPMLLAADAPVEGTGLPLVAISHGGGGSAATHRDLAAHLASAGFVAALVEHPGNNRDDNRLAHTAQVLENRPRHIRAAIDAAFADPIVGQRLAAAVGVIGHSLGGYTALAMAGGKPTAFDHETPDGKQAVVPVTPDPRVKALVLLAPAVAWFAAEGALAEVSIPVLMLTGEKDLSTPQIHGRIVARGLRRGLLEHREVAGAGHFAFQSPFPPAMRRPGFLPAQDPEGFDRAAFHEQMNADIEAFLRRTLAPGAG